MIQDIDVKIDKKAIQEHINKQLDEAVQSTLWFVDVDRLIQLTCMSRRFLELEILNDVRMKAIERRKARKKYYPAKDALNVINAITSEW